MFSAMLPSAKALGIPELLEMVLDHATSQDLLLWQRVNKAWQAAIRSSPRIQERLFFRVREICERVFDKQAVVANPFVKFFAHKSGGIAYLFSDDAFDGKKASHPAASWRQMYLSSPAVTELELFIMSGNDRWKEAGGIVGKFRVTCENGITVGQFADALKEHLTLHVERWQAAGFLVFNIP